MFRENDRVRTLVSKAGFATGTEGVIVSIYAAGPACEVELWNDQGYPVDVVTYLLSELKRVETD